MEVTIQNSNNAVSAANFMIKKLLPPGAITITAAEAAFITQAGTTAVAVVNQPPQAELLYAGSGGERAVARTDEVSRVVSRFSEGRYSTPARYTPGPSDDSHARRTSIRWQRAPVCRRHR